MQYLYNVQKQTKRKSMKSWCKKIQQLFQQGPTLKKKLTHTNEKAQTKWQSEKRTKNETACGNFPLTVRGQRGNAQLLLLLLLEHVVRGHRAKNARARPVAGTATLHLEDGDEHLAVAGLQGRVGQLLVQVLGGYLAPFQTLSRKKIVLDKYIHIGR